MVLWIGQTPVIDEWLAEDVNQDGQRQAVAMCSVLSEDIFSDTQFFRSENKPGVVVLWYFCDNKGSYGLDNKLNGIVALAIALASDKLPNFDSWRWYTGHKYGEDFRKHFWSIH